MDIEGVQFLQESGPEPPPQYAAILAALRATPGRDTLSAVDPNPRLVPAAEWAAAGAWYVVVPLLERPAATDDADAGAALDWSQLDAYEQGYRVRLASQVIENSGSGSKVQGWNIFFELCCDVSCLSVQVTAKGGCSMICASLLLNSFVCLVSPHSNASATECAQDTSFL